MSFQVPNEFPNDQNQVGEKTTDLDLITALKLLGGLDQVKASLNLHNQRFTKLYNAGELSEEQVISFIRGLVYYKNQGATIVFTGGFDPRIMLVASGEVTDIVIEDDKVKVAFNLYDGTPRSDEVEIKDAFVADFSFHCP